MKKNFRIVLALVLALSMVLGMVPAMAAGDGGDEPQGGAPANPQGAPAEPTGTITINSPIMGAKYFAYQIFRMTLNNPNDADAFGYFIDKDDPFYAAVKDYAEVTTNGLTLTGIPSTMISAAVEASEGVEAQPAVYDLYAVTVDDRFDAQVFGQAMEAAVNATGDDAMNPAPHEYTPDYEMVTPQDGGEAVSAGVVTPAKAAAIKFSDLPYGYYLITNNYDSYNNKFPTVHLIENNLDPIENVAFDADTYKNGIVYKKETVTNGAGQSVEQLVLDDTGNPIIVDVTVTGLDVDDEGHDGAAQRIAKRMYPDLAAARAQYEADHKGDPTVKTWEQILADDTANSTHKAQDILDAYRASYAQDAIAKVKNQIIRALSDDNAYDGKTAEGHKARLVFIDSTTPDGVINEKNEYEKWDVPVNPEGYADAPDTPNHDEPEGGKNIVVGKDTNGNDIYANSIETHIGDKVHYQLSINAVNFERADKDDPKSVKQIQEYIIADYQNKNMEYVAKVPVTDGGAAHWTIGSGDTAVKYNYGLTVRIVKKDAQGNITETSEPMDYSAWAADGRFFVNVGHTDLGDDNNIFDTANAKGGIVIPWVTKVRGKNSGETPAEYQQYITSLPNVYKNSVYEKDTNVAAISATDFAQLSASQKELYFLGDDDKYYKKIPVYAEAINPYTTDKKPVLGQQYMLEYGDGTLYDWIQEGEGDNAKYYLVDPADHTRKIQQIDKNGEKVWKCDTVYFQSKYDNDVTILVDYWMELKDTAVIDGNGNVNISQFGVNYIEPYTNDYPFGVNPKPGDNPPEGPQIPDHLKEQDDAVVYTYAIAIKKVDVAGNPLVGAKFKLRGVTTTEKTKGYYKVASYDHNAPNAPADAWNNWTELETDDKGLLIVEGLPTKWEVEIMETEAPLGYNKLTDTVKLKPFKTGDEVNTSSEVTYTVGENGEVIETVTSTETVYRNGDTQVAKKVQYGTQVTYYLTDNTPLTDDASDVQNPKTAAQKYEEAVAAYTAAKKVEITKDTDANIAEYAVVNNKGAELPSTGGIGTTIFYVGGSLMVLAAAILLITKRRMGAED